MKRFGLYTALTAVLLCSWAGAAPKLEDEVAKSDFSKWKLSEQPGGITKEGAIFVEGDGKSCNYWLSEPLKLKANGTYRIKFLARSPRKLDGTAVTGPVFCNVDLGSPAPLWTRYGHVFAVSESANPEDLKVRLGQWHLGGRAEFAAVQIVPVIPLYLEENGIVLGEGEKININEYEFSPALNSEGRNHSRPLVRNKAGFNTHRWVFGQGSEVVYRMQVNGRSQLRASLEVNIHYYSGGIARVYASKNNRDWTELASATAAGSLRIPLPESLFPASEIYVRIAAEAKQRAGVEKSDPGAFQVNRISYRASLTGSPTQISGKTNYVEVMKEDTDLSVVLKGIGDAMPGASNAIAMSVENKGNKAKRLEPVVSLLQDGESRAVYPAQSVTLKPGEKKDLALKYDLPGTGKWSINASFGGDSPWTAVCNVFVSDFFDTTYGELLPVSNDKVDLWWASSGWKIPRTRVLPKAPGKSLLVRTACNEAEAAQLVLRPRQELRNLKATASQLEGPKKAVLAAENVEILQVYYHEVRIKTDATGILGEWPDALPPLDGKLTVNANQNQPLWVRVTAPKGTPAGIYNGTISLSADGWNASVPLKVEVYGFELPDTPTCESGFGLDAWTIARYHHLQTPEDRQKVFNMYLETFSKHRLSPYNPVPYAKWFCDIEGAKNVWYGGKVVKDQPEAGKYAISIVDEDKTNCIVSNYGTNVKIPNGGLKVSFRYKAPVGQKSLITISSHDKGGHWMSGCNHDLVFMGTGDWKEFQQTVTNFKPAAETVSLTLRPTLWTQKGELTGSLMVSDFLLADAGTGKVLVQSDFKPVDVPAAKLVFDWTEWDKAARHAFDTYHFNSFRMSLDGLGGGTFHSRHEPAFKGYKEGTPEYTTLYSKYLKGVEEHLAEVGLLDKAYVYWFDEPDQKDYEFVMNGFRKLKTYAPRIRRLLTEQVEEELIGGPNLWCPVSSNLAFDTIPARKAAGDTFWWYVCTGPKAPYATLFIDHPGSELRVWLWQTWKAGVQGILVWQSNYWTSNCAYPDKPQNPYLDPMGWVSGYDTPAGTKNPWGNGDGRFVYPPLSAADASSTKPVFDKPVDSFRFEMLRDGVDDYEYFAILKRLLAAKGNKLSAAKRAEYEALLTVPEDVTKTMTSFTTNPAPMEIHRDKLARAIMKLSK